MALANCVGENCPNQPGDVRQVQALLARCGLYSGVVDGVCGRRTIDAVRRFQESFLAKPDGRVDPGGTTWKRLQEFSATQPGRTEPETSLLLTEEDYENAARELGCEIAAIKAVAEVESAGAGFLKDGRPRILFEGHWFHHYTKGDYSETHPTLSHPRQTNDHYSRGSLEQRGAGELERLSRAQELDASAALLSCSVGKFQVMGFNYKLCGFSSVQEFWKALASHEREQLKAFCAFVKSKKLVKHLINHDWAAFAAGYNGPNYKKFSYDAKIAKAYAKFSDSARTDSAAV